jgi:uncharacterized protein
VPKYRHDFTGPCPVTLPELAVLAELLLRGAQTPGELRNRSSRMAAIPDAAALDAVLQSLAARPEPLVVKLPAAPGQREARYAHCLSGDVAVTPSAAASAPTVAPAAAIAEVRSENARLEVLERTVAELQTQLADLRAQLAELLG